MRNSDDCALSQKARVYAGAGDYVDVQGAMKMEYEIRTPNSYVYLEMSNTGVVWKIASGAGKRYKTPAEAVRERDMLRDRGYMCEILPVEV